MSGAFVRFHSEAFVGGGLQPSARPAGLKPRGSVCLALLFALLTASSLSSQAPNPQNLQTDLDRIFADPALARALMAVRVESLSDGRVIYASNDEKHVMPASNMKIVTLSVAADRLGWDFRYTTRLEAAGPIVDGTLRGDVIVIGGGDPSIGSLDGGAAPLFAEWAGALARAGIRRIAGRVIGDDDFFDDEGIGAGWAWDYLGAGYAARSGALSYNENAAVLHIRPGRSPGEPVVMDITPPGHRLNPVNAVRTGAANVTADLAIARLPGSSDLTISGIVPAGGAVLVRSAAVDSPTRFFVEALRLALAARGIHVDGGAWDIDEVRDAPVTAERRLIASSESPPLSSLAGYFMKVSQNFYAETMLKTLGRVAGGAGTTGAGRRIVLETLASWGVPADALVIYDGSGLSRYNYVTAGALVTILKRMWHDEGFRAPFTAALPVAGHDGTLDTRMKGTVLDARVEAKTGTISNVRALSGYLETQSGQRLVFSMIANHFTAPTAQIDGVVERALGRLAAE